MEAVPVEAVLLGIAGSVVVGAQLEGEVAEVIGGHVNLHVDVFA